MSTLFVVALADEYEPQSDGTAELLATLIPATTVGVGDPCFARSFINVVEFNNEF